MNTLQSVHKILVDVNNECDRARTIHAPIKSVHEAVGVIDEEHFEWKLEAYAKNFNKSKARKELIQLAASCVNAIRELDLTDDEA